MEAKAPQRASGFVEAGSAKPWSLMRAERRTDLKICKEKTALMLPSRDLTKKSIEMGCMEEKLIEIITIMKALNHTSINLIKKTWYVDLLRVPSQALTCFLASFCCRNAADLGLLRRIGGASPELLRGVTQFPIRTI